LKNSFLKNNEGNGSVLMGLAIIMTGVMAFALMFDIGYLIMRRDVAKNALDFSNMAVYREINEDRLADGELYINKGPAEDTFLNYLQHNFKLDSSLNPLPNSIACGQVEVVSFEVFNSDDLPATDTLGNTIDEVSVHSRLVVPLEPMFIGLFTTVNMPVAITTDIPEGVLD